MFHPSLKLCVVQETHKNCKIEKSIEEKNSYHNRRNDKRPIKKNISMILNSFKENFNFYSGKMKPVYSSPTIFNVQTNSIPLNTVQNPSIDLSESQLHHLKDLVDNFKKKPPAHDIRPEITNYQSYTSSTHRPLSYAVKNEEKLDVPLGEVVESVSVQLAKIPMEEPHFKLPVKNCNANESINNYDKNIVNALFKKYLLNSTYMSDGEFTKDSNVEIVDSSSASNIAEDASTHNRNSEICPEGKRIPKASDCTRYYLCGLNNKIVHTFTCPQHTAFSVSKNKCNREEYKICTSTKTLYENKPDNNITCTNRGRYPITGLPSQYTICIFDSKSGWKPYVLHCPLNMIFCLEKQTCVPKDKCW